MTDDQQGEGGAPRGGRWDPLPQGDYDDGATAFFKLPEGAVDAPPAPGDSPLAAPGHGYVPPQITVAPATTAGTDPAATGTWSIPVVPADGADWHTPGEDTGGHDGYEPEGGEAYQEPGGPQDYAGYPQHDPYGQAAQYDATAGHVGTYAYDPAAGTGHWDFAAVAEEAAAPDAAPAPEATGHDVTGQWSIPVAGGDLPEESGEFTASALAEQYAGTAPATLPGGAPAPWAVTETPAEAAASLAEPRTEPSGTPEPEAAPEAAEEPLTDAAPESDAGTDADADVAETVEAPEAEEDSQPEPGSEPEAEPDSAEEEPRPDAIPAAAEAPEAPEPLAAEQPHSAAPAAPQDEHPLASYVLRVNGVDRPVTDAWIGESLLYVLRERLGLAGAKDGCSQGECGACNVQVDGRLVASCLVPSVTAAGSEVRTVEGLAADGQPSDVQRALARCGAVQCGFCVPGMAMTVHNLLEGNPAPTDLEARQALCGNLCRCSGYRGVLDAVQEVVAERRALSGADSADTAETDADEPRIPHQAGPGAGGVHASAFDPPGFAPGRPDQQHYGQDGGQA
ncbi:2Fe-2S iron-sulfur cluster-binding protein [Streptomyces sp. NPDC048182]|uniref:2Fe-2S iron-sulfur cluster-binding protein n=1 Tax=Streptomyces sp. NPDC048182 TaxID=3365507 RepID=UPI0037248EBB